MARPFVALVGGIEMEVWDVAKLSDGRLDCRRGQRAGEGANVLLMNSEALDADTPWPTPAAAIDESTNRGHREDTIRSGAFADQDIVAMTRPRFVRPTSSSVEASSSVVTCEACLTCADCPATANPASWVQATRMPANSNK